MERCHGTTKAGERCKRSAREGSRTCSSHADQEERTAKESAKAKETTSAAGPDVIEEVEVRAGERDDVETLLLAAALGVAVVVVVAVGRLFRL